MKINVLNIDNLIISHDVNPNDLVEDVKTLLKLERQVLLYDGKEMNSSHTLSEVGVKDGDLIKIVSNSATDFSSSTTELGLNPVGSSANPEAFQNEIGHNSYLVGQPVQTHEQSITNSENGPRDDDEISLAGLAEKETVSLSLDEERYSEQNRVVDDNDVYEVLIQSNGGSNHTEEDDDGPHHVLNASDKESSIASIQTGGPDDHNESNNFASSEHAEVDILANHSKGTEIRNPELRDSSLSPNPPQATSKGRGLKKWRRLRREVSKDPSSNSDSTKVLKRGSANILDVRKPHESPVSSTNAIVKSPGDSDLFSNPARSSDYKLALGTTFSAGADDSEDRSSKSSTAASAPKYRYDIAKPAGYHQKEKHRAKNASGRHSGSSGQRFHLGKGDGQSDASKKPRGESISEDKENSLSSMESDSRSYSTVFVRGSSSVNSDRVQSGRSGNYDEEDAYDQQTSEVQSSKELRHDHSKNGYVSPDCSAELSCSANLGKSKEHQVSRDCEPLLNSILMLQSAQEALEREVQMFKEIGKGVNSLCDNLGNATSDPSYSMFVGPEDGVDRSYVQTLEMQLDEAQFRLKEKDIKVIELEDTIKTMNIKSLSQADERNLWKEMENELESVFKQKIEAEVQYVALTGTKNDLGALVEDQIKLLRDQKFKSSLASIDAANKGYVLLGQAKSDNFRAYVSEDEECQKMRNRIDKYRSYLVIQLVLLVLVIGLFLLRVLPKSATVVPT